MNKFDFSDLLSALEQEGKDARRRQQITQTIKQLESHRRRKVLYFSVAAACAALLILPVAINLFLNRHHSSQPVYIAQQTDNVIKHSLPPSPTTSSPTLLANNKQVKPQSQAQIKEPYMEEPLPEEVSAEDNIEAIPTFEIDDSQIAETAPQQPTEPAESQPIVTPTQLVVSITQEPEPQPSQPTKKEKKRRHFRFANPSNMDGTVLAFNLKK